MQLIVFCTLAGLVTGLMPLAANAQEENDQSPLLLVKIRNIEQLLSDVEKLIPPDQNAQVTKQIGMVRMMLQGTDWIDPERSIVVGIFMKDAKINGVVLIPFRKPNPGFQQSLNAIGRADYYVTTFPPQQAFTVSPSVEESLFKASIAPSHGSLVVEAPAGKLLSMFEAPMAAALKKMEEAQSAQPTQPGAPPINPQAVVSDILNVLKQADTVRFGMDFSGNVFSLLFGVDAVPNTLLANALVDPDGETRLMDYPIDMPLQFRSRAPMAGMVELQKLVYGKLYSQLGINFDDLAEFTKSFTGEMAGGLKIDANGLSMEVISILQPGINGEDFLQKTYLPWLERSNQQISKLIAKNANPPRAPFYKRTADSTVSGIKVAGIKANLDAVIPPNAKKPEILDKMSFEMRLAAVGDMLLIASNDAQIEELIKIARSLVKTPAHGPTFQFDMNLGAFLKDIKSLLPPGQNTFVVPDNLGNVTMTAEMKDGQVNSRLSFNIDEIKKLVKIGKAQTVTK